MVKLRRIILIVFENSLKLIEQYDLNLQCVETLGRSGIQYKLSIPLVRRSKIDDPTKPLFVLINGESQDDCAEQLDQWLSQPENLERIKVA